MKISLSKRIVSFVLCLTVLLAGFAYKPQKTEAVAVTASVVASVAAIMTACGVGYWAASQQDAIDYLGGKIDEYFFSLEDSLGTVPVSYEDWLDISSTSQLFDVVSGGVMRFGSGIANKILDFVRWFNDEEGVESGGPEVGLTGSFGSYTIVSTGAEGGISVEDLGGGVLRLNFVDVISTSSRESAYPFVYFKRPDVDSLTTTFVARSPRPPYPFVMGPTDGIVAPPGTTGFNAPTSINWEKRYYPLISYPYIGFGLQAAKAGGAEYTGYVDFQLSSDEMSFERKAVVTPSPVVAVPEDLADDDSFDVAPSVTLTQGMTVDQASEAVLDGVASEDGLTSETAESEGGASEGWGWLSDILSSIRDFVAGIAQTVLGMPQVISQAAQDVISGIQSLPQLISDALVNLFVPDEAYIGEFVASLHGIFDNRFSILSYPFSVLGEFITRASGIDEDEPILRWPDIYEPFSGHLLIGAGSYNLNQIRQGNFAQAHGLYMVVVKGWIAFEFLGFLYSWFCSVFKMREDDFVSPLEAYDGGDDG